MAYKKNMMRCLYRRIRDASFHVPFSVAIYAPENEKFGDSLDSSILFSPAAFEQEKIRRYTDVAGTSILCLLNCAVDELRQSCVLEFMMV